MPKFRFNKVKKEDLKVVDGNLYLRVNNYWYLFVKGVKGYTFETGYGEGVFSVTDSNDIKHIFYTASGMYMRTENVEVVVGEYVNAEYLWNVEALVKNSENAKKMFAEIETTLSNMNGEVLKLKSANKYTDRNEYVFGLPDLEEDESDE